MATPAATPDGIALLSPAALPKVLGEALLPGVRVVSLMNRSGLLLGCAGDAQAATAIILSTTLSVATMTLLLSFLGVR